MYVNGEGVKRDNVLGYAWAAIALENGGGEAAKGIVAQLEPHLNAAARSRIAEVQAQFGKAALEERLFGLQRRRCLRLRSDVRRIRSCQMRFPSRTPTTYYPNGREAPEDFRHGAGGSDGRARRPRAQCPRLVFVAGKGLRRSRTASRDDRMSMRRHARMAYRLPARSASKFGFRVTMPVAPRR